MDFKYWQITTFAIIPYYSQYLAIGLIFYTNATRETGRCISNKCILAYGVLTIESSFGLRIQDGCQKTRFVQCMVYILGYIYIW